MRTARVQLACLGLVALGEGLREFLGAGKQLLGLVLDVCGVQGDGLLLQFGAVGADDLALRSGAECKVGADSVAHHARLAGGDVLPFRAP